MKGKLAASLSRLWAILKSLGPYAAIELILPGGSVVAVLLWVCPQSSQTRIDGC